MEIWAESMTSACIFPATIRRPVIVSWQCSPTGFRKDMSDARHLFCIHESCDQAVADATQKLVAANLQVIRTFDLQVARSSYAAQGNCNCPFHGTEQCDCQIVILLVFREGYLPTSLVVHGHHGQ